MAVCALVCMCDCDQSEVGGLHSLSLYSTKPHWYFEKEINIAISGGSCMCASTHERRTSEKPSGEFPLQIRNIQAEVWAMLWCRITTAAISTLTVNSAGSVSIQAGVKGKPWVSSHIGPYFTSFSLLYLPGWRTNHQWKCCSWLIRSETLPSMGPWQGSYTLIINVVKNFPCIMTDYVWLKL